MSDNYAVMLNVFRDKKLNHRFNKFGYVVVDFLKPEQVSQLGNFYSANPHPNAAAFHTTHFAEDKVYKKEIHTAITKALQPGITDLLLNYQPVLGNYMVKEGRGTGPMPLHADWTYVQEPQHASISIWVPLVDTNEENGCIGVIPFSQHLSHPIRGPRILQWEYPTNDKLISAMGKLLPMKAGQALIYDHRLLHYSPANNSPHVRPAVNLSLVPCNVRVIHYTVPLNEHQLHLYDVTSNDFYIYYDNFKKPELGVSPEIIQGKVPMLEDRVDSFIQKYGSKSATKMLEKFLKRLLSWS